MKTQNISAFCMQISLLLGAAISLDNGLSIMAEDAADDEEKRRLTAMAEDVELGDSLATAMERTGAFPRYVIKMAQVGQETGTLETVMSSLADYYEKENLLVKTIRNAVTYPLIMIFMLILVLFVLLTKVVPIFESVYAQLGAQISSITKSAVQVGSFMTGAALALTVALALLAVFLFFAASKGRKIQWAEKLLNTIKNNSKIAESMGKRRFASVIALSIQSGLELDKGIELSLELVEHPGVSKAIKIAEERIQEGESLYESFKATKLFTGMDLQMIKVGIRSGRLDSILDKVAEQYQEEVDLVIDRAITRFEPTMVAILALAVGLILLSVMMPLVGMMAAIG